MPSFTVRAATLTQMLDSKVGVQHTGVDSQGGIVLIVLLDIA